MRTLRPIPKWCSTVYRHHRPQAARNDLAETATTTKDRAVGAASATLQDDCQVPTGCRQPSGLLVEASGRTEHSLEPRTANGGTLRKHHSLWSSPDGHDSRGDPARDSEGHHSSGVIDLVRSKRWHDIAQYQGTDVDYEALRQYSRVKDELTVNECGNEVVRNYQIVIPQSLQHRKVELAHEGHQGICKTKALLRSKVWFPGADAAAEEAVRRCIPCQANTTGRQVEPLAMSPLPRGPWLNVSIDFCGPIPSGEYLLVMVDECSRYPVVEIVRSTAAETVISVVDKVLSLFGLPEVIKSDNGPAFQGHAWKAFLKECGVRHRRITPLWPQVNGQVENLNKSLEKSLKAASVKGKPWRPELQRLLRAYRCTPHTTTNFTPHRLLYWRDPRTKLPQLTEHVHPDDEEVRTRDQSAKASMKAYADGKNRAREFKIGNGNVVLVRQRKSGKLSTPFDHRSLVVTNRKGSMVTARRHDGSTVTRNVSMFHTLPYESAEDHPVVVSEYDDPEMAPPGEEEPKMVIAPAPPSPGRGSTGGPPPTVCLEPRRSTRHKKPTQCLLEEV